MRDTARAPSEDSEALPSGLPEVPDDKARVYAAHRADKAEGNFRTLFGKKKRVVLSLTLSLLPLFYYNVLRANRSTSYRRFAGGAGGSLTREVYAGAERAARTFFVRTARRFVLLLLVAVHFSFVPL